MKKLLLALFALTLLASFTAPSYAADFKYSGWFRVRGYGVDNLDGNDDADDNISYMDWIYRPKFTAKSKNVTAMLELHTTGAFDNGDDGKTRPSVFVNRWSADHAIPGSALRLRWGRHDYAGPDGEIFDNNGWHREHGIAVYGKLSKNVSLSMFHTKNKDNKKDTSNADKSDYFGSLSIKASPALTLTPWAANSRDGADNSYNYSYLGLNAKGKAGVLGVNVSGVFQSGDLSKTEDISAWAILVRTTSSFGRMKLTGHLTMLSGDDKPDNENNKFMFPAGAGSIHGGLFMSSRSLTGFGAPFSRNLAHLNGAVVLGVSVDYKVSKTLMFRGAVYSHNAAESSPDANTDDAKDYGTELNAGLKWQIYPSLYLAMDAGIMMRGDYGKTMGGADKDDAWMAAWRLNHNF